MTRIQIKENKEIQAQIEKKEAQIRVNGNYITECIKKGETVNKHYLFLYNSAVEQITELKSKLHR